MNISRPPRPVLQSFVELIWATDGRDSPSGASDRELVLPTGATHVVFRLADVPLRIFAGAEDGLGRAVGCAVVGGARDRPYLRDISRLAPSVGALLRPGAAGPVLGVPAGELSGSHTALEDVWGRSAVASVRARLADTSSLTRRLEVLEAELEARLAHGRPVHPLVARALAYLDTSGSVHEAVRESGYSHRHFTKIFGETVGFGPKTWCRVRRFGCALDQLHTTPGLGLADLAADRGYADQAHFSREFRAMAGLSPGRYRRLAPSSARHVPIAG